MDVPLSVLHLVLVKLGLRNEMTGKLSWRERRGDMKTSHHRHYYYHHRGLNSIEARVMTMGRVSVVAVG